MPPIEDTSGENIAATLARVLPKTQEFHTPMDEAVIHYALPQGHTLQKVDVTTLLPAPRRKTGSPSFARAESFADYVKRHQTPCTVVWCNFNPQTFALSFTGVINDHAQANGEAYADYQKNGGDPKYLAGWRDHRALFTPDMSAEWKLWKSRDAKAFGQVEFAEFIEANSDDITSPPVPEGQPAYPTDLQMLQMATNFVAQEERSLKSAVKLQSGGVRLSYIADPDSGTVETMDMFSKFALGIPVFQDSGRIGMFARLKYRMNNGKVSFFYELIRPDRVHELAAKTLINDVRELLPDVPLLMGAFS